jgi:cell division protein FtsB
MTDLIFTGTTEEGETVSITLSSLMNAKWNWPDTSIRTASTIGEVNVLADSIQSADYDELKAERDALRAEVERLKPELLQLLSIVNSREAELEQSEEQLTLSKQALDKRIQANNIQSRMIISERAELVALKAENERLMKALKLCIPLLRDDVIEEETGQCYYCGGRDEDNGDAHKDDCRQVIAYLTARVALEPKP